MLPYQMIAGGKFSLTAANIASGLDLYVQSQQPPDFVVLRSITGYGEASDAQAIEWWWEKSMAQDSAKGILQSSQGSTPQLPAMTSYAISSSGIRTYNNANPPVFAPLAATAITGIAGTFVVSMANTGSIAVGDWVRLYNVVGEQQLSGLSFQVTAVSANVSITLGYMADGGQTFAADATAAQVLKYIPSKFYPRYAFISNISQASQAVVKFTGAHDFTPGEIVSFRVNSEFGMEEINNVQARVLSIVNSASASSITLDLDSSGFTAFAFPTSANAADGFSPAVCLPSSSGVVPDNGSADVAQEPPGTNLRDAFDNRNKAIIHLGAGLFNVSGHASDAGDVWMFQCFKYDDYKSY